MSSPVLNKKELIDRIQVNKDKICSYGVIRLGIFGSFVRSEINENSDVDFFVEIAPDRKTLKNFIGLADILEEITGRSIELVTPQSLSKYIGPYILKEVEYVSLAA